MSLFFATLGFLTRFPVPYKLMKELPQEKFKDGIIYYSLIGLITGTVEALVYLFFSFFTKGLFPIVCAILSGILFTGAFHLDGLADTCDGLFSSRKKEQMLEIMRDSRVGTNGAIAIVFDIFLKISLFTCFKGNMIILAFLAMPVGGKMITPLLLRSTYARTTKGLGSIYLCDRYSGHLIISMLIGISICFFMFGNRGVFPILVTFLGTYAFRLYCEEKIGGMTGDTLGCGSELGEILFLLGLIFV